MPRPTAAQFAYGALTVVLATVVMLLTTQARSGPAVAVVCVAALALGLAVSLVAAARKAPARAFPTAAHSPHGGPDRTRELPAQRATSRSHTGTSYRAPASLRQ